MPGMMATPDSTQEAENAAFFRQVQASHGCPDECRDAVVGTARRLWRVGKPDAASHLANWLMLAHDHNGRFEGFRTVAIPAIRARRLPLVVGWACLKAYLRAHEGELQEGALCR